MELSPAIFHAARAVLHLYGSSPITHRGVVSEFGRLLVNTGKVDEEYSKIIREAREERQIADYEVYERELLPDPELAQEIVNSASRFVKKMEKLISD